MRRRVLKMKTDSFFFSCECLMLDIPVTISPHFVPAPHSIQWRKWEEKHKGEK